MSIEELRESVREVYGEAERRVMLAAYKDRYAGDRDELLAALDELEQWRNLLAPYDLSRHWRDGAPRTIRIPLPGEKSEG